MESGPGGSVGWLADEADEDGEGGGGMRTSSITGLKVKRQSYLKDTIG